MPITDFEKYAQLTSGNKDLTADFNSSKCVQADISKCIQTKEGFANRSDSAYPILIAIGVLAILIAMK
jgi:hypothetical protein